MAWPRVSFSSSCWFCAQALCGGGHGGDRRRQAALHELARRLEADDRPLAQLVDALAHDGVVGLGGRETVAMLGGGTLDPRRQRHQLIEQRLLVVGTCTLALQRGHQVDQRALGLRQRGPQQLGHRQPAQRHQAVGLELEQARGDAAGACWRGIGRRHHQQAFVAVGAQRKVGDGDRMAGAHRAGQRRTVAEPGPGPRHHRLRVVDRVGQHDQLHRRHRAAGDGAQPVRIDTVKRQRQVGQGFKRGRTVKWLHEGVARELAVALPLQAVPRQIQVQEVGLQIGHRQALLARQQAQVRGLGLTRHALVEHGDVHHQRRQRDARRRSRMHLVVQRAALRVVGGKQGVAFAAAAGAVSLGGAHGADSALGQMARNDEERDQTLLARKLGGSRCRVACS
jgi:hypothetical protein